MINKFKTVNNERCNSCDGNRIKRRRSIHYVAKTSGSAVSRVGTAGTSGTDMILNTLTWGIGDDVSITAWTTSQPK
jgi:hypothetical protein